MEDYARRNGFGNIRHFTDDGFSGVNFNRPGFQALIKEGEAGNVATIIVKDMSRLGRKMCIRDSLLLTLEDGKPRFHLEFPKKKKK